MEKVRVVKPVAALAEGEYGEHDEGCPGNARRMFSLDSTIDSVRDDKADTNYRQICVAILAQTTSTVRAIPALPA